MFPPQRPIVVPLIFPGAFGTAWINNLRAVMDGLWPQALEAATSIFPPAKLAEKFTVMDVVPWPLTIVAPAGIFQT